MPMTNTQTTWWKTRNDPRHKPYLPDRDKLDNYPDRVYDRQGRTDNGYLVQELTQRLEDYLRAENLLLVSNGALHSRRHGEFSKVGSHSGRQPRR